MTPSSSVETPRPRVSRRRNVLARWWLNLPLRDKGLLVVIALPLSTMVAAVLMRIPYTQQQQETTVVLALAAEARDSAQQLIIALVDMEAGIRGYATLRDEASLARYTRAREIVPAHLSLMGRVVATESDRQTVAELTRLVEEDVLLKDRLIARARNDTSAEAASMREILASASGATEAIRAALDRLREHQDAMVTESQAELNRLRRRLSPVILLTLFGGLFAALIGGWLFATGIAARVSALERNAERLARGERLVYEQSRGLDELGSLDRTLRRASLRLRTRERELRAVNAQLERTVHEQLLLNRELEAFSYSVSHDLRAPLRSIDGFAQALREDWGDRLDESAQDHLSRVRNAAQRMGRLIDDLLKLSRLTRSQIQRAEVDLSAIAREVCTELSDRNPTRNVDWQIADDLRAWCDPSLARIILENLLGNAWKFTSKTTDARIEFTVMPGTHPTVFVVRDNGAGFDMRYVEKLFAPFQRLHGEREFPGTGIGLATVQRIVHKHGGEVRTQAEVGHGAAFYFTLASAEGSEAVA
jgi:signal transduction histidine kinase